MAEDSDLYEGEQFDRKSIRVFDKKDRNKHMQNIAQDCVAFANTRGGVLHIGIEDDQEAPPPDQKVHPQDLEFLRRRIRELTVSVDIECTVHTATNGGQYIELQVPRSPEVTSTQDGRYYIRIGDQSRPLVGSEVTRLSVDRAQRPWESMTSLQIPEVDAVPRLVERLSRKLRMSTRVKASVKEKTNSELIRHYNLASGGSLTNLGVLMIGQPTHRQWLGTAPIIQAIKKDEQGLKIWKASWDTHELTPLELLDSIWETVPDFRESQELTQGMLRTQIPAYEQAVFREILVNALVHRPYTQRGDIFINLSPAQLEIVNPGRLPVGVTPHNILHQSRRRNDALARLFHDLELMEREGSGFDLLYERLLTTGRPAPEVREGTDSVHVTIKRLITHHEVYTLLKFADEKHQLSQRELITLGLLAQIESITAESLSDKLGFDDTRALRPTLERLKGCGLIQQVGNTRGTRYFVAPALLRHHGLDAQTTLERISPHRLQALIYEDLKRHPSSSSREIHQRIGSEISARSFRRELKSLVDEGVVQPQGQTRARRYVLKHMHEPL